MTREEFQRVVNAMQNEGVPLTMPNLMVRTELPRAQIEAWLDEMQRDLKTTHSPAGHEPADRDTSAGSVSTGRDTGLVQRAKALKSELLVDTVRSQLGAPRRGPRNGSARRSIKTGGVLGLLLPPAGLLYAAPIEVGVVGTALYLTLAYVGLKLALLGGLYLLPLLHLAGGALGLAYAWRFNRNGRRAPLLPKNASQ